ncbi:MAG: UbiA family prenyltransferase, partial [Promethearchaeota archaeon]
IIAILTIPLSAIGIWTLAIVVLFAIVGLFYAAKGKVMGLFGNFAVSVSFAFGLFYGTLVTFTIIPPVIFVYFITAASVLQGRETIKGIEDIEGDSLRNVQTIARKYGIKTAAIIAATFNIIGIIAFYFPWFANSLGWNWTGFLYIIFIIPGMGVVGASTILILRDPVKYASRASLCDKVGAFLGLTNFVLGAL